MSLYFEIIALVLKNLLVTFRVMKNDCRDDVVCLSFNAPCMGYLVYRICFSNLCLIADVIRFNATFVLTLTVGNKLPEKYQVLYLNYAFFIEVIEGITHFFS